MFHWNQVRFILVKINENIEQKKAVHSNEGQPCIYSVINYAAFLAQAVPKGRTVFPATSLIMIAAIIYHAANAQKINS